MRRGVLCHSTPSTSASVGVVPHQIPTHIRCDRSSTPSTPSRSGAPPRPSYDILTRPNGHRPLLLLAPMENLADVVYRRAFAQAIGGCDEICSEFLRCPDRWNEPVTEKTQASVTRGIAKKHDAFELADWGMPLAAQIMGSNPEILEAVAGAMARKGACRVDLNCGCPANVVTGKGAGSSMLRDPTHVHEGCKAIVRGVQGTQAIPTLKMRAGFADTGLFEANLEAVEAAGAFFLTIHPRTKVQRYEGAADWALIARAAAKLKTTHVIGNGDISTSQKARSIVEATGVRGLMVGRGVIRDPLIFYRIRLEFGDSLLPHEQSLMENEAQTVSRFLRVFAEELKATGSRPRNRNNRMKQICSYLFTHNEELEDRLEDVLKLGSSEIGSEEYTELCSTLVEKYWRPGDAWTSTRRIQGLSPQAADNLANLRVECSAGENSIVAV